MLEVKYDRTQEGALIENQKKILGKDKDNDGRWVGALPDLIREVTGLHRRLLHFATGYFYAPFGETKLKVEFNDKESPSEGSLPVAHTCENTVKLPAKAYGGDVKIFKQKLMTALNYYQAIPFDMQ